MTRAKLTRLQLEDYFDRLCVPQSERRFDVSLDSDVTKLEFLQLLQTHQLVKVPWENLTQHYSWHGLICVSIPHLFAKIIHSPGRGGYCMEANYLFHIFLYSLGFDTHMLGARIFRGSLYGGWTHNVNVVRISGQRYLLDGGYGPRGPIKPFPLQHGTEAVQIFPAQGKLTYDPIPDNLDSSQRLWIYHYRKNPQTEWTPQYCFSDLEFTPADIEAMNFEPSSNRRTFFTHKVVAARFITDGENDAGLSARFSGQDTVGPEINGSLTIDHDVLRLRGRNGKKHEKKLGTEEERILAIEQYFGILLDEAEQQAITGTAAQIGGGTVGLE
jgi:arylamine N-acetyltransferase